MRHCDLTILKATADKKKKTKITRKLKLVDRQEEENEEEEDVELNNLVPAETKRH